MTKEKLLQSVAAQQEHLFDLSCQIFDFNEPNGLEYKSSALCADELEKLGFTVERAIGNQETSFRAVWKNGEGGPNIGILGEYDSLVGKGHACGHHLQTTAAIGAVKAMQEVFAGSDIPMTLTVYGTPAEETYGERFEIPTPDELVFISWFSGGEVFRSGCCWRRGLGKVFYFRPGHEAYPVYYNENIRRVLYNAVRWARPSEGPRPTLGHVPTPYESIALADHSDEYHP